MFQSQGSPERRWRVGGEVKAERNALFLCVCLVCGNRPSSVSAECSHYAPRGASAQRPLLCVTVSVCVSDCVRAHPSFSFNSRWHLRTGALTGVGPLADASPPLSPIETRRHNGAKRSERGMSVGLEERVEQIGTERGGGGEARGDRRHFHISRSA